MKMHQRERKHSKRFDFDLEAPSRRAASGPMRRRPRYLPDVESVESRCLLATFYAANPASYDITTDVNAPGLDAGDTVTWMNGDPQQQVGLIYGTDAFGTIQTAIDAAAAGDVVRVANGTYVENLSIAKDLTLESATGRANTTIQGVSGLGALGAVLVTNNTTGVTIGGAGKGFTILGIDNGNPAIDNAAIYFQGGHSGAQVLSNEVVANGEHGLLTEYGPTLTGFTIDGNVFSGKTFVGAQPGGIGFGSQWTTPNVPRQLVVLGNGGGSGPSSATNITFTNNQITGTAGGISSDDNVSEQGNTLVTLDVSTSTISGNTFAGTTTRYGAALRVRRPNTTISGNTFSSAGMSASTEHLFLQNNSTPLQTIVAANTFDRGSYVDNGSDLSVSIAGGISRATAGQTVNVLAGTYSERLVVDKALTLRGRQAGVDPRGTGIGARPGGETIVRPPTVDTSDDGVIILVKANDVTIDGFTLDGYNTTLSGGDSLGGGVFAHAGYGISNSDASTTYAASNLVARNNVIKNLAQVGFYGGATGLPSASTGNVVEKNVLDNMPLENVNGKYGWGVVVADDFYAKIDDNDLSRVRTGIQTNNFYRANTGPAATISGNEVVDFTRRGILHNLQYANASPWTISNNTMTALSGAPTPNGGLRIWSLQNSVSVTLLNNSVTGADMGIEVWNVPTTSTITIQGGTLTGNATGISVPVNSSYGVGLAGSVSVQGVTLTNDTTGIAAELGSLAIGGGTAITGGTTARPSRWPATRSTTRPSRASRATTSPSPTARWPGRPSTRRRPPSAASPAARPRPRRTSRSRTRSPTASTTRAWASSASRRATCS